MPRIDLLDGARTVALAAMAVFHLAFDLMLFGHLPAGYVFQGGWPWFARAIAASFLFLAGLSLWLAHGKGLRRHAFARRLAFLVAAAAAVSIGTWFGVGDAWVRWGILHMIAAGSLIGLAFLRLPAAVTLAAAGAAFAAPHLWRSEVFDDPLWLWLGLGRTIPPMIDYEPVLPWVAPVLAGIAIGRLGTSLWPRLARVRLPGWLTWPGRHSLAIYLVHQPVLMGGVWLATRLGG